MKHLIIVNGTMGAGKTTVCRSLTRLLPANVFLDGDWCWDMNPFTVTEETKTMVLENIAFLLNQFLSCSSLEYVIFCWVIHQKEILSDILSRLQTENCSVLTVSLICSEEALRLRLEKDVEAGLRTEDVISRSVARLDCYRDFPSVMLDVSDLTPGEAAARIAAMALSPVKNPSL